MIRTPAKTRFNLSLLLCCLLSSLLTCTVWAQESYPMVCRGGGSMRVDAWRNGIQIYFRGADTGASQRQPGPGECAWLDRGLRSGEPRMLTWFPGDIGTFIVKFDGRGMITGYDIRGNAADNYKYLLDNIRRGSIFYVHSYRPQGSTPQLRITRIGP